MAKKRPSADEIQAQKLLSDRDLVPRTPAETRERRKNNEEKKRDKARGTELKSRHGGKMLSGMTSKEDWKMQAKLARQRSVAKLAADKAYELVTKCNEQINQTYHNWVFEGKEASLEGANAFLDRYQDVELSNEQRDSLKKAIHYVEQVTDYALFYEEKPGAWVHCRISKNTRSSAAGQRFRFLESGTQRHLVSPLSLPAERLVFE